MTNEEEGTIPCRVILIGENNVGKKSIRLIDSTPGICGCCHSTKTVNIPAYNKSIIFDIKDPAGREQYKSVNKL